MKIGDYDIFSIETSRFALDGGAMFGVVPKTIWENSIPADEKNRIALVTRSLFLKSENRNIIIDTGNGDKWENKHRSMFKIDTETVNTRMSLEKLGLTMEDVTDVVCTHLHFDHAGGNTRLDGRGRLIPSFPNATYWIQRDNWNLANSPSVKDRASYRSENWTVLAENGMIELVDGEDEFIPGLKVILTDGHTAGQQLPKISDRFHTVFFGGDLIPTVHHLRIPWVMAYDNHPMQTIAEKSEVLARMVKENWILFFEHDPVFDAIDVEFDGENYRKKGSIDIEQQT